MKTFQVTKPDKTLETSLMIVTKISLLVQWSKIQWNPVNTDTKGRAKMSELSGCPYKAGSQIKATDTYFID